MECDSQNVCFAYSAQAIIYGLQTLKNALSYGLQTTKKENHGMAASLRLRRARKKCMSKADGHKYVPLPCASFVTLLNTIWPSGFSGASHLHDMAVNQVADKDKYAEDKQDSQQGGQNSQQ